MAIQRKFRKVITEKNSVFERKPVTTFAFLFLTILAVFMLALELFVRSFMPEYIPKDSSYYYEADSYLGWTFKKEINTNKLNPFGVKYVQLGINREGFRDAEIVLGAMPEKTKLLFIGDSVTAAIQVDTNDRYSDVIQRILGKKYLSLNMGVNGYSTDQSLMVLNKYCSSILPDYVVYTFVVNDLRFNFKGSLQIGNSIYGKPYFDENMDHVAPQFQREKVATFRRFGELKDFLRKHFASYSAVVTGIKRLIDTPVPNEVIAISNFIKNDEEQAQLWANTKKLIEEMKSVTASCGAELLLIEDIHSLYASETLRSAVIAKDNFDIDVPRENIKRIAHDLKISILQPSFDEISKFKNLNQCEIHWIKDGKLYDGHMTECGNEFLAQQFVQQFMRKLKPK